MNRDVHIHGVGNVKLTDKNYIGEGGEAVVYRHGSNAIKIYHDSKHMLPLKKIEELRSITADNVLIPKEVVYEGKSKYACGYMMDYVDDTTPLCRLFTKAFKKKNNISHQDIVELVSHIQRTIMEIHRSDCLIVDLNEMNILVNDNFVDPLFIDVDSYGTKSFPATAIMESIRDRKVRNNDFTRLSDWYSFAIIAFQLYIGIHPYKGKHPNYKPSEWPKRMEDGVSVFDSQSTIPTMCNDFSVIPKAHLDWMKSIFVDGKRSVPPAVDGSKVFAQTQTFVINSKGSFDVELYDTVPENIVDVLDFMGVKYYITNHKIYKGKTAIFKDVDKFDRVFLSKSNDMTPIICKLDKKNQNLVFEKIGGSKISEIKSKNAMCKNGVIYSVYGGKLCAITFTTSSGQVIPRIRQVSQLSELSTKFFDGVICQSVLGKPYVVLPYSETACINKNIPELEGQKLVDMRSDGNILVAITSKDSIYNRYVFVFDSMFKKYTFRMEEDIHLEDINFTALQNGICVMSNGENVEVFKDNDKVRVASDSPFDSSMKLFNFSSGVYFIENNNMYKVTMK
jgi:tRNA A-37 threonylcarbamoyl transferase component Bud32